MIKPQEFKLKNGIDLIVIPQKDSPSISVAVLARAGSAYETKNLNGISHFLEHMFFKGTKSRPTPMMIASEFESLGASFNAFTSRDLTAYWGKVAYPNGEKIMDLISDMYCNPLFDEKQIEKEKGVIIEEINMYEDDPRYKVSQILERTMYGNQPAGWDVAGPKENIKKITREDFIKYRTQHYNTLKSFLVVAGNIDVKTALAWGNKYLSSIKRGKIIKPQKFSDSQTKPAFGYKFRELDQTHFIMAFKAFSIFSKERFVLALLSDIIGGGMSSRLFQKIREELGAAYYVGSSPTLYGTHGYLDIFAGVNHGKSEIALKAIRDELQSIVKNGVTQQELDRVKEHRMGQFLLSLETSSDLAFYYGEQKVVTGKMMSPEEVIKNIKSVTKERISRLAKQVLDNSKLNFAVIGPYKSINHFKKLLS